MYKINTSKRKTLRSDSQLTNRRIHTEKVRLVGMKNLVQVVYFPFQSTETFIKSRVAVCTDFRKLYG